MVPGLQSDARRLATVSKIRARRFRVGFWIRSAIGMSALLAGGMLAMTQPELSLPLLPLWLFVLCSLVLWNDRSARTLHEQLRQDFNPARHAEQSH
jgi:hypothetical protein